MYEGGKRVKRKGGIRGCRLYHVAPLPGAQVLNILQTQTAPFLVDIRATFPAKSASTYAYHGVATCAFVHPHFTRGALFHSLFRCHDSELSFVRRHIDLLLRLFARVLSVPRGIAFEAEALLARRAIKPLLCAVSVCALLY